MKEAEEAILAQKRAEEEAEAARIAAEEARKNIVYEDKPIEPNPWVSDSHENTIAEVDALTCKPSRDPIKYVISRPKMYTKQPVKFMTRDSSVSGVAEFRSHKDPNFIPIAEADIEAEEGIDKMQTKTEVDEIRKLRSIMKNSMEFVHAQLANRRL